MKDLETNESVFRMEYGQFTNASNLTSDERIYVDYPFTDVLFPLYGLERAIYLYIWIPIVVITLLVNLVVLFVLTRKALRSATNVLLVAIAITDSLTGLVALPSYMMVYNSKQLYPDVNHGDMDLYLISEALCNFMMLSTLYFSRVFHTMSTWLTLYLGLQRFVCVKFPFATKLWFTKNTHTLVCIGIVLLAPILHTFHLTNKKVFYGECIWLIEDPCTGSCAHIIATLFFMHLIPCIVLSVTTALFAHHILHNRFDAGSDQRAEENRRVSKIVIAIVVVFLIPELPYAAFLVYLQILANTELRFTDDLKRSRTIHAFYEVFTLLSFNANFFIYTVLNRRFRREMKVMFLCRSHRGDASTSNTNRQRGSDSRTTKTGSETNSTIALESLNNQSNKLEPRTSMAQKMETEENQL